MTRVRDEHGFTLVELLISMTTMLVVIGGALALLASSQQIERKAQERLTSEDGARQAVDLLSRQLRNLASPTEQQPQAVDLAEPDDLVFQTVSQTGTGTAGGNAANIKRVRWCLDAANGRIVSQEQTWTEATPPPVPSTAACPDAAWGASYAVAGSIVNTTADPVFLFDTTTLTEIVRIRTALRVDADPGRGVPATEIASGIFLRNQNRKPIAVVDARAKTNGHVILNGSASYDPEGESLSCLETGKAGYEWSENGTAIGTGVVLDHEVPVAQRGVPHTYTLIVRDPACLPSQPVTATVTPPAA